MKGAAIVVQSTGNRMVFYTKTGSGNIIGLDQLSSGGIWSGGVTMTTAAGGRQVDLLGAKADTAGVIHLFLATQDSASGDNTVLSTLPVSAAGSPGALTAISGNFTTPNASDVSLTAYNPTLNQFAVPVPLQFDSQSGLAPQVVIGSPAGWSTISPDPNKTTVPAGASAGAVAAVASGSSFLVFWNVYNSSTGLVDQLWYATWTGPFSAPVLLYDAIAHPAAIADAPSPSQQIQSISIAQGPTGNFGLAFTASVTPPAMAEAFPPFYFSFGSPLGAQVAFWGVRRIKGNPGIQPKFKPKSFSYQFPVTVTAPACLTQTFMFSIVNYDFELHQIGILGVGEVPQSLLTFYDQGRIALSNIPALDSFWNAFGKYGNGAIVPPLLYKQNSILQVDVQPVSSLGPYQLLFVFTGIQRFACQ